MVWAHHLKSCEHAEIPKHFAEQMRSNIPLDGYQAMKTINISKKDMEKRVARFKDLKPLPIQQSDVPLEARDIVYARKLLSVIGLEDAQTPINAGAPIRDAAGITIKLFGFPPRRRPGERAHRQTNQTINNLKSKFELTLKNDRLEPNVLEMFYSG